MMKCARDNDFDFVAHRFEHGFPGYAIMTDDDLIAEWHEVKENYEFFWEERPYDVA